MDAQQRRNAILILATLACLVAVGAGLLRVLVNESANFAIALASERVELTRIRKAPFLHPAIDIKTSILGYDGNLYSRANAILSRNPFKIRNLSEMQTLVHYFYVTGQHDEPLRKIVPYVVGDRQGEQSPYAQDSRVDEFVRLLDETFLFTAYLFERLGDGDSARAYYTFYLQTLHGLAAAGDLFQEKALSQRRTVAQVKIAFLQEAVPKLRTHFYRASYYSFLIERILRVVVSSAPFAEKYAKAGFVEFQFVVEPRGAKKRLRARRRFMPDPLYQLSLRVSIIEDPYLHLELCSYVWGLGTRYWLALTSEEEWGKEWLETRSREIAVCPHTKLEDLKNAFASNSLVFPLVSLLEARGTEDWRVHIRKLEVIAESGNPLLAQVRDDAMFQIAMLWAEHGEEQRAAAILEELLVMFPEGTADASFTARRFLNYWKEQLR